MFGRRKRRPEPPPSPPSGALPPLPSPPSPAELEAEDEQWLDADVRAEAEAGDPAGMLDWAASLRDVGRLAEAREWLARASDAAAGAGDEEMAEQAAALLVDLLPDEDPRKEELLREHGERHGTGALRELARHLERRERWDDVVPVLTRLRDGGDWRAALDLARVAERSGRTGDAVRLYREAMREPRTRHEAAPAYGALLAGGATDPERAEGEELLRRSGRAGAPWVAWLDGGPAPEPAPPPSPPPVPVPEEEWGGELLTAWQLEHAGRLEEAERWYRNLVLADPDQVEAAAGLGRLLVRRGETAEGRRWLEEAEGGGAHLGLPPVRGPA